MKEKREWVLNLPLSQNFAKLILMQLELEMANYTYFSKKAAF